MPLNDDHPVEVWQLELDDWSRYGPVCHSVLTPREREQAEQFRFQRGRERFILGRGMMRHTLARLLDTPPADVALCYSGHGKPSLEDSATGVFFNLSHSGDMIIFAVARGMELGIDIEQQRPLKRRDQIAKGILAASELSQFEALAEQERQSAFFTIWTRKEAIVKAVGKGLCFPLTELEVSLSPEPQVLRFGDCTGEAVPWHLCNIECGQGYSAALATDRPVEPPAVRKWNPVA